MNTAVSLEVRDGETMSNYTGWAKLRPFGGILALIGVLILFMGKLPGWEDCWETS
jgi:hypothetical protein